MSKKLLIGFILLPIGVLITPLVPEFGVPIILLSTRFLQEKYLWARKLNLWVDAKFASSKVWFRKLRKKKKSRPISRKNLKEPRFLEALPCTATAILLTITNRSS